MLNNDVSQLNDIVVRLEELYACRYQWICNYGKDRAAIDAEADTLFTEMTRIATDAKWKGTRPHKWYWRDCWVWPKRRFLSGGIN